MKNKYIQKNEYSRPGAKLTAVKKIVMHWTANLGGTALNHYNYFNSIPNRPANQRRYASAHIFVDTKEALCIVPLNEVTYHANEGSTKKIPELRPNANFLSVGVEMCVEKDGKIAEETFQRSVDVVVDLCKKFKLTEKDIVRHYDITGKSCPTPWVVKSSEFERFKKCVGDKLKGKPRIMNKERCTIKVKFTSSSKSLTEFKKLLDDLSLKIEVVKGTSTEKISIAFAQNSTKYAEVVQWLEDRKVSYTIK